MKKILIALFTTIILATFMIGCNPRPSGEIIADIMIDKDYKGKVSLGYMAGDVGEGLMAEKLAESFKKEYANIQINLVPLSGNYSEVIAKQAGAGNLPDVIWCPDLSVSMFAGKGYIENITSYLQQAEFDETLYYKSMLDLGKMNMTEGQYMLPRDNSQTVMVYNKTMFSDAGIEAPAKDWTQADFLEVCKKLKSKFGDKQGFYPVTYSQYWEPQYYAYIKANGGELFDDSGNIVFNEPEIKVAADKLNQEILAPGYADRTDTATFITQTSAMQVTLKVHMSKYQDAKLDFDFAPMPKIGDGSKNYIAAGTSGYAMFSRSSNKREAFALLLHMIGEEGQKAMASTGNLTPVMKKFADDSEYHKYWYSEGYRNDVFTYNADKTQIPDFTRGITKYDKHETIRNIITNMLRDYWKNGKAWQGLVDDTVDKVQRQLSA